MIDANHNYILVTREAGAVITNRASGSLVIAASMKPHHYRALSSVVYTAGPDIEIETILTCIVGLGGAKHLKELSLLFTSRPIGLRCVMAKLKGVAHTRPGLRRLRRHESICASSRCTVWNAFEFVHAVDNSTAHFSCASRNSRAESAFRRSQGVFQKGGHKCARGDAA